MIFLLIFGIMFSQVNISEELLKAKQKHASIQQSLKRQAEEMANKGMKADEFLLKRINNAPKPGKSIKITDEPEKNKVFSTDDIKSVCITYRLRFLKCKDWGKDEIQPGDSFMAYGRRQVALFTPIDKNNYFLVKSEDRSFNRVNKWLFYPLRSIWTLLITLITLGLPVVIILPAIILTKAADVEYYRMLYLAAYTIYTVFVMVFGGFAFYKNFSRINWKLPPRN